MTTPAPKETTDHGIASAYYDHGPAGLLPTLECACGWRADGIDWEEAGAAFDEHLAQPDADRDF